MADIQQMVRLLGPAQKNRGAHIVIQVDAQRDDTALVIELAHIVARGALIGQLPGCIPQKLEQLSAALEHLPMLRAAGAIPSAINENPNLNLPVRDQ